MSSKALAAARVFFLILVILVTPHDVHSWSSPCPKNDQKQCHIRSDDVVSSRRQIFQKSATALATALVASHPSNANAACLQGDTRPVCIGIYKVPLDDNILPYVSTPEQLEKFAPGLNYVPPIEYPKSFESAMNILQAQRKVAEEIRQHVLAGKLEEAGVGVLGLIPQVTNGCRRIVNELEHKIPTKFHSSTPSEATVETLALEMVDNQASSVTGYWGDCDITIGQGIRGELGMVTVAQLAILESIRDATGALDDFLVTAETLSRKDTNSLGLDV